METIALVISLGMNALAVSKFIIEMKEKKQAKVKEVEEKRKEAIDDHLQKVDSFMSETSNTLTSLYTEIQVLAKAREGDRGFLEDVNEKVEGLQNHLLGKR